MRINSLLQRLFKIGDQVVDILHSDRQAHQRVADAEAGADLFRNRCVGHDGLGGVESLINHPAIMTHASVPEDIRARLGISDTLVRLSVGVEDVGDLIADLEEAL